MNCRRLRIGAATAIISVVAATLAMTTSPAAVGADCFTTAPTPTISGLVRDGDPLTVDRGTWQPEPDAVVTTWYVGGALVEGSEPGRPYRGNTYIPDDGDVGKTVVARVTATLTGCGSMFKESDPTIPVHPSTYNTGPIANPPTPSVAGDFTVGKTVTADPGAWPAGTKIESYRWYVVSEDRLLTLDTTSGPNLKLPGGTFQRQIAVRVTATLGYSTLTTSPASAPSAEIAVGTLTGTRPTITGIRKVGRTLTAVRGTWTSGTKFAYRWFANGHAISGATNRTFTPKAGHAGRRISVRVSGTQTGYTPLALTSAATRPIAR